MNILVTGGAGFIGRYVVNELVRNGHKVVIVDNLSNGRRENIPSEISFYEIDLNDKELGRVFYFERPDQVIHLAAQISVRRSMEAPIIDAQANILGTMNILECCIKNGVSKIIYTSSAAVYGNPQYLGIDEKHPTNPISFYGISKLVAEEYIKRYSQLYGINYIIFRLANVYGNCNSISGEGGVVYQFINSIISQQQPVVFGDGEQTRDLIYAEDVAKACSLALYKGCNETYNLGTGIQTSINEILNVISMQAKIDITPRILDSRVGDILHSYLNSKKVTSQLGWMPRYTLTDGICETLESIKQNNHRTD